MTNRLRNACLLLASALTSCIPAQRLAAQEPAKSAPAANAASKPIHGLDTTLLDPKAAACDNFYRYACGPWLEQNPIPADRSRYGRGEEVEERNILVLKAILEKAAAGGAERTPSEQKIGDAYASCMDTAAIDQRGLAPLRPKLDEIAALQSKAGLPALLAAFGRDGVQAFFYFSSDQDARNAAEQIAEVDQPFLGLPERGYYLRTDEPSKTLRDQYEKHIAAMLVLSGEPEAEAATDARTVLTLETAMATASLSNEEMRDPQRVYHRIALDTFSRQMTSFAIADYLKDTGAPAVASLNVAMPDYFAALDRLIAGTGLAAIQTYLRWQLMHSAPELALPAPLDQEAFRFYGKTLRGQPEQQARWKRCVGEVDEEMGEALGQVYVAQRFSAEDKARTLQLALDVEAAMGRDIDQLSWMSAATKARAKEKLHTVANKIGYPDKWRDYSTLTIVRGDALGNAWRAREFARHRDLAKIGQPVDRGEWGMSPPTVNAYYNPQMNDVNFPAGILQPPYFDPAMDDAVNYGDAGGVIGHELTHGFDDQGRQYDAQGNLKDWWTPADTKQFNRRAECVVDEYNSFVAVDDLHVNGRLTLGENLADLGGLRIAYLAYLERARERKIDLTQRTDGFTPAQRFFLGYAQGWCEGTRPASLRLQVETDPHSPEEFRVNGVVRNLPEFQQAFGCAAKQPMVAPPSGKLPRCTVW